MDWVEMVRESRQKSMKDLKDYFQPIANAISPNIVVDVHWSLNDPIVVPAMPAEEAEPDLKPKRKAKARRAKKTAGVDKAEKKAFYMSNYWRRKKGLEPLSKEAWKASRTGKSVVKEEPSKN